MSEEFRLPDIGEGLAEGEIVKWLVSVGDNVVEDQPLVEVMTDKATVEIPSPRAGTIAAINASEGDVVEIGTTILVFADGNGAPAPSAGAAADASAPAAAREPEREEAAAGAAEIEQARQVARAERDALESAPAERKPWEAPPLAGGAVAPAARRLAGELGVEVGALRGSGPGGLVTKEDVRAAASGAPPALQAPTAGPQVSPAPAAPAAAAPAAAAPAAVAPAAVVPAAASPPQAGAAEPRLGTPTPPAAGEAEERVALRGLRRTIAERMVAAKTTVPHYTYVEEVDMTEVVALRREAKARADERGVKLTYLPFIIRALVLALEDHPYLNASLDEEAGEIVLKRYYNIGIATDTERGLMVPVVKHAQDRDLFELGAEISRLAAAAREGKIALDDLHGGTFTITSTGNIGGFLATPIINVPEVAILGVTAIRERPVVRHGEIVVRQMANLSLSCDHRVVDGAVAALFMRDLVKLLEDPKLQLLAGG